MSIFKDTLLSFVQNQIEARKQVVSQWGKTGVIDANGNDVYNAGVTSRKENFLRFTTGKNAWVKMQSFVDIVNPVEKNGKVVNGGLKVGSKTYYNDELARKYILEGGTLYEEKDSKGKGTNKFTLRSGVGLRESTYASDIDLGGDRPLGYRPMPGITSVQINNKSAYGSLREATIKFYAWDKHQLEELELLYMRTGYSVLLEWGWSQYLNSSDLTSIKIENFLTPTIDIFYDKDILQPKGDETSDEVIYSKIDSLQNKTYGNYDAMLGYVKNFSWQLMSNGGFECTTVLISRGEVISTLKLNSNGPNFTNNAVQDSPPLSLFENIMLNYSALINESELTDTSNLNQVGQFTTGSSPVRAETKDNLLKDLNSRLDKVSLKDYNGKNYSPELKSKLSSQDYGKILLTEGNIDGIGIEYIQMDVFIALINLYFNFKDQNNKTISQIIIPVDTPCLAGVDSISVDPTTCIIYNSKATYITGASEGAFPKTLTSRASSTSYNTDNSSTISDEQFLTTSNNLGKIGNIFISIPKILEIYRSKGGNNSDVSVIDFLKDLLNQISKAIGGINDFQLHTSKSTVQIIDVKYLETGSKKEKYTLDLLGLKSVCRDVKITSRIFESQSSMIAIAAQSRANIGDIYSSTQNQLNKGLRDRILIDKVVYDDGSKKSNATDRLKSIFTNLITLQGYIARKCTGVPSINDSNVSTILYPTPEEVNNAVSLLKTFLLQLDGEDIDFKAIIPFELEIVLDGISGLVQGQIFKVDASILPSRYHQSNIGFIITGLSHSLQNNDWTTSIKTQICLLDNEKIPRPKIDKDQLGGGVITIKELKETRKTNVIIWTMLTDYMTEVADRFYKIIGNGKLNFTDGGWFGVDTPIPVTKTTPRDALEAYSQGKAGVYNPLISDIATGDYLFFHPYKTDQNNTANWNTVSKENDTGQPFGYIVTPDINKYASEWIKASKIKFASDTDYMAQLNKLNENDAINSIRSLAETEGGNKVSVPFNANNINEFLSYPTKWTDPSIKHDTGQPYLLKDSFMLRSLDYVNYIKSNTTNWNGGGYPFDSTYPLLFNKVTVDNVDKYYYIERLDNAGLFNLFYRYIYDSKYFSNVDAQFAPSAANQAEASSRSIYDKSVKTISTYYIK